MQTAPGGNLSGGGVIGALRRPRAYYRRLWSLILPIVLQNLINFSLSMADALFLGAVGENEISAVTLATSPFFVIVLMVFGFQSGGSVLISQYWGKRDETSINRILGITMGASLTITAAASVLCMVFPRQIMSFFTPYEELRALACQYMVIVAPSYILDTAVVIYCGACRSMEKPKPGMYIMSVAMLLNTGLNYILIFGKLGAPAMSVRGAALATLISRVVEFIIALIYALQNKDFHLNPAALLHPGRALRKDFIRYAGPVVVNETMWGLGTSMFPAIFGRLGGDVVASYTLAGNVDRIFNVAAMGLGNASGVLVGNAIGAGDMEDAYGICANLNVISVLSGIFSGLCLLLCLHPLSLLLNVSEGTRAMARTVMGIYALRMPAGTLSMTLIVGLLRAGGRSRFAMLVDLLPMWLFSVPGVAVMALIVGAPIKIVFLPLLLEDYIKVVICLCKTGKKDWMLDVTRTQELFEEG